MLQMEDSALSYREKIPVVQHAQVPLCCQTSGPRMRIPTQGKKPSLLKQPSYKRIDLFSIQKNAASEKKINHLMSSAQQVK